MPQGYIISWPHGASSSCLPFALLVRIFGTSLCYCIIHEVGEVVHAAMPYDAWASYQISHEAGIEVANLRRLRNPVWWETAMLVGLPRSLGRVACEISGHLRRQR